VEDLLAQNALLIAAQTPPPLNHDVVEGTKQIQTTTEQQYYTSNQQNTLHDNLVKHRLEARYLK
jgi:hypothetical protein